MRNFLSVTIMGTPSRKDNITQIVKTLEYPFDVVLDDTHDIWGNFKAAAQDRANGATHHLVLQDDITLCDGFIEHVMGAISAKPDVPITFYNSRKVVTRAREKGKSWATMRNPINELAFCFPVPMIDPMITWCDANLDASIKWADSRMSTYFLSHNLLMWITCPSLVEHTGWRKSTMGNPPAPGGRPRVAAWFEQQPGFINWLAGKDDPEHDPAGQLSQYKKYFKVAYEPG
jgi:hypothetical protein